MSIVFGHFQCPLVIRLLKSWLMWDYYNYHYYHYHYFYDCGEKLSRCSDVRSAGFPAILLLPSSHVRTFPSFDNDNNTDTDTDTNTNN